MTDSAAQSRPTERARAQALNVTLEVDAEITDELVALALDRTVGAHPAIAGGARPVVDALDLRHVASEVRRSAAFEAAEEYCRTTFDRAGARVRACNMRMGESSVIALAIDPDVCDAWSANIIADEISGYIDAHVDGTDAGTLTPDDGPGVLARRAEGDRSPQREEARRAARQRAEGVSLSWWPEHPRSGSAETPWPRGALRDLDDAAAAELTTRCRTARASIFPLALLCLQLLQTDPVTPRAVISTFAARETEEDYGAVGHFAVDVLVPVSLRGLTVSEALTAIRDDVFGVLGSAPVPWQETAGASVGGDGPTVSVLYLPAQLSGGMTEAASHVTRASVSVCPTGADVDLFVIESPPVDEQGRTPLLRLGGTVNRNAAGFELEAVLDRWAACMRELATSDTPWSELVWPEVATRTKEGS